MTKYKYVATPDDREIIRRYKGCAKMYSQGCRPPCDECEYRLSKNEYLRAQMLTRF